jgi:hypothetical protein
MKTSVRIATYVGVLLVGGAIGTYVGLAIRKLQATTTEIAEAGFYLMYIEAQRTEGNDAAYEDALRTYLKHVENRRGADTRSFEDRVYNFDSTLAYTRLSALASKRGAKTEAVEHLRRAVEFCGKAGWRDCSPENLFTVVQRLDKKSPLTPKRE